MTNARVRQIQAADEATLDRWIDALAAADDLESVFRPVGPADLNPAGIGPTPAAQG